MLGGLPQIKKYPGDMMISQFQPVRPRTTVPFVWSDRTCQGRRLGLRIGSTTKELNIDKETPKIVVQVGQERYSVEVSVTGNAKKIKISAVDAARESRKQALFLQSLLKRCMLQQLSVGVRLEGLGLSFIDDKPAELLFLSLFDLRLELQRWAEQRQDGSGVMETVTKAKLHLQHLQLDNMAHQVMPVILAPTKPLVRDH